VDAFASLLAFHHGQIGSLNVEQPDQLSPRNRHCRNVKKRTAEDTIAAQDAVTLGLLVMLDDDDPLRVFNAYYTLRLAFSVSDESNLYSTLTIPQEYRQDIECLKTYKRSPRIRAIPNIEEALNSEKHIECASRFSEWVTQISILLSDTLASEDLVFGQLSTVLASDVDFAEQVLPILIHTILQRERQETGLVKPIRAALSKYFTKILSSPSIDNRCIRSIVEIVLHLRNILPARSDALAYNRWLEIDFSLLARSATLCGAYTTALLFVELAAEHDSTFVPDSRATEQVLYEIYAHIDEPDGFYGIKTQDLQQFLVKRFHHEKQYDKAFRFHAAALEVNASQNQDQIGLLKSFHSFGFDHLAIDTLRYFRESEEGLPTSQMNYELGWRTETWDLPDNRADAVGTALYRSLRAIYRERDTQVLDHTIRTALYDEMERLRSLGSENLVEIRMVSQNLLCLREILQWRRQYSGKLQPADYLDMKEWQPFVQIDENFE
jgi:ataxia telangiectasia mutated family protein